MGIDDLIGLILFILPGYITFKWKELFSNSNKNIQDTTIEKPAEIILFSIPVVFITQLILSFYFKVKGIHGLIKLSYDFKFLTCYLVLVTALSILLAFIWTKWIEKITLKAVNKIRSKNKKLHISPNSVWEQTLSHGDYTKVVCIYPLGDEENAEWGFLTSHSRTIENEKQLYLEGSEDIKRIKDKFINPEKTFIDIDTQTVIRIFDYDTRENEILS